MQEDFFINSDTFNDIYYLYIRTLIGKLIKKGKKEKALKFYNNIKENIKLDMNKKKSIPLVFLLSMLNSMPKLSFKEMRLGSQKKDIPISISENKQVLICVDTLLKLSKKKKKLEIDKLINYIISSYKNEGIVIKNKKLTYRKAIINRTFLNVRIPKRKN
jgi:ribosomal protein S7